MKTIPMTPTWAATLRIYGMAIQNGEGEGVRSGHEGLQEAANHLDNTFPKKVRDLKADLEKRDRQIESLRQQVSELTAIMADDRAAEGREPCRECVKY